MKFYLLSLSLTMILSLTPLCAVAQDKQPPKTEQKGQEHFDEKIDEAQSRFDDQLKAGQERFDNQVNNPGKTIKPKKEKRQKVKKTKVEKPSKQSSKEVVEVKPEPSQVQVKEGGFKQQPSTPDEESIVCAVRTSATVPILNITPEKARSEAIRIAKEEALRIAVGEHISASTTVVQNGSDEVGALARISTIGSRGGIVSLELTRDTPVVESNGAARYEVEIVADIKIYPQSKEPSISFNLQGIKPAYTADERMTFAITASDSCFVYIFLFDTKNAGTLLVPSRSEPKHCFACNERVDFPSNRAIQYTLTLDNPLSSEELNTLLVVAFKKRMPITSDVSCDIEKTLCWINKIDPSERSQDIEVIPIRVYPKR